MPVRNKKGFTLIEILLVIVVMSILATIIMGATTYVTKNSRVKRAEITASTLETAITRYFAEYNKWPGPKPAGGVKVKEFQKDNEQVFGMLRQDSPDNKRKINFIDETTLFTYVNHPVKLSETGSGNKPLVYMPKSGDTSRAYYFNVKIDYDNDIVTVTAPDANDEKLED